MGGSAVGNGRYARVGMSSWQGRVAEILSEPELVRAGFVGVALENGAMFVLPAIPKPTVGSSVYVFELKFKDRDLADNRYNVDSFHFAQLAQKDQSANG